jgi:pimeloyl-ACP methyl ester carboxylesterase
VLLLASGCLAHHSGALPGEPEQARFAHVRGARVRYVDEGKGPAVVLIHGFAASLGTWEGVRPALRKNHRVLALDLKGFGWSSRPDGNYSPREQARIVEAVMDERGIERAAVVGHSYGASVALALALQAPSRVERLALYDAWVYEGQLPTFFHWARPKGLGEMLFALFYDQRPQDRMELAFYDPKALNQKLVDSIRRRLERPGTKAAALATVRGMRYERMQKQYAEIEQPTLLLWGREDHVAPLRIGERLVRQLPRAQLRVYPRCGHFPMIEAASASTRDLAAFLEGKRVPARLVSGPGSQAARARQAEATP